MYMYMQFYILHYSTWIRTIRRQIVYTRLLTDTLGFEVCSQRGAGSAFNTVVGVVKGQLIAIIAFKLAVASTVALQFAIVVLKRLARVRWKS